MMKSVHNQEKLEQTRREEEEGRHGEETTTDREREREKKVVWVVWFCGRVGTSTAEERER
jgi:hypothetical protein